MDQAIKTKNQNNHYEFTQGDTFKHYGSGDQNVDKRVVSETKSYWKESGITLIIGVLISVIVWYFRLNALR